jgi:hypothetical protein
MLRRNTKASRQSEGHVPSEGNSNSEVTRMTLTCTSIHAATLSYRSLALQFDLTFQQSLPTCTYNLKYWQISPSLARQVATSQARFQPAFPVCRQQDSDVRRDSSVGIAISYGLDGPGIESRWRRDFPHPSRPALYNGYRVIPGGKAAGAWR